MVWLQHRPDCIHITFSNSLRFFFSLFFASSSIFLNAYKSHFIPRIVVVVEEEKNLIYVLVYVEHSFLLVPFPESCFSLPFSLFWSQASRVYNLGVVKKAKDTEFLFENNRHNGCRHIRKKQRGNLIVNRWSFGKLDTQPNNNNTILEWVGEETAREVGTSTKWHLDIIYNQFYSTAAAAAASSSRLLDSTELKFIEFVRLCLSCFGIKLDFWGFSFAFFLLELGICFVKRNVSSSFSQTVTRLMHDKLK